MTGDWEVYDRIEAGMKRWMDMKDFLEKHFTDHEAFFFAGFLAGEIYADEKRERVINRVGEHHALAMPDEQGIPSDRDIGVDGDESNVPASGTGEEDHERSRDPARSLQVREMHVLARRQETRACDE